jgi:ferredoxin
VRAAAAQIRLADEDRMLAARPGETLLEALERHGYHPDFSCRAGACGTCRLRLLAGRVSQAGDALSARERAQGYVLSCVAQPLGDVTLASAGSAAVAVGAGTATGSPRQPAARRVSRRVLRWTLAAAAVALFVQTWTVTSQTQSAQAAGSDSSQPSNTAPCSTSEDDNGTVCVAPNPTPSGPSSISTSPTYPTPTPSTHSGSSR